MARAPEVDDPAPEPAPLAVHTFEAGQGPPLVMLGGGTDTSAAFREHAESLGASFRVVHVQSLRIECVQRKQPLPSDYSIKTESASLERALDRLGIVGRVDLVGLSFGALVALDFALDYRDRVRTLVLAEPPAFWAVPAGELRANAEMWGMVELGRTLGPAVEPTDEQLSRFLSLLRRPNQRPHPGQSGWEEWVATRAALRGLSAVTNHVDDPRRLKNVRMPVLIVTGRDTVAFHRRINDILAELLPVVDRVELPGGHRAAVTARGQFIAELQTFLARHR